MINDADPALAKFYIDVKTKSTTNIVGCRLPASKKEFVEAKKQRRPDGAFKDPCDYLRVIKRSYGCRGHIFNMPPKYRNRGRIKRSSYPTTSRIHKLITNADMYKEKLSKTTIMNTDFCDAMTKYDSKDTFHYLDPPYWDTHERYGQDKVHPSSVVACASKMKGLVLVSYDNHPQVRKAFKGWKTEKHKTKYEMQSANRDARGEKKDVVEVLMMNYNPKTGERIKVPRVAG